AAAAMKWWGWGEPDKRVTLPAQALRMLREELGEGEPSRRVKLEEVALPPPAPLPPQLVRALGEGAALAGREQRLRRAAGRSYPDLIRLRSGRPAGAPDAVLMPASREQLAELLAACAESGTAVVPFGGGTSVVGGVEPLAGGHE